MNPATPFSLSHYSGQSHKLCPGYWNGNSIRRKWRGGSLQNITVVGSYFDFVMLDMASRKDTFDKEYSFLSAHPSGVHFDSGKSDRGMLWGNTLQTPGTAHRVHNRKGWACHWARCIFHQASSRNRQYSACFPPCVISCISANPALIFIKRFRKKNFNAVNLQLGQRIITFLICFSRLGKIFFSSSVFFRTGKKEKYRKGQYSGLKRKTHLNNTFYEHGGSSSGLVYLCKITNIFLIKTVIKHNYCNFAIRNR